MKGHSSCVYTQPTKFNTPGKRKLNSDNQSFTLFSLCYPLRLVGYIFDQHNLHFQPIILVLCRYSLMNIATLLIFPPQYFVLFGQARGIWDLSSSARGRAMPPAVKAWSPNHWMAMDFP